MLVGEQLHKAKQCVEFYADPTPKKNQRISAVGIFLYKYTKMTYFDYFSYHGGCNTDRLLEDLVGFKNFTIL